MVLDEARDDEPRMCNFPFTEPMHFLRVWLRARILLIEDHDEQREGMRRREAPAQIKVP